MINHTIKRIVVPLTFIFLFSLAKAESKDSAFLAMINIQQENSSDIKKYELSEKLFEAGDYEKSVRYCLALLEDTNSTYIKILANSLLAKVSRKVDDREKAIYYLKKSISYLDKPKGDLLLNDSLKIILSDNLLKLGGAYQRMSKIDSASIYYNEIENIKSSNITIITNKAKALSNLAGIYTYYPNKRNLDLARDYVEKAIKIHFDNNKIESLSNDYGILANIYEYEGDILKAKRTSQEAIKLIESIGKSSDDALRYKEILYDNYAWVLYKLEDFRAFEYLEKSYNIRDELNDANLKKEIKKIEARHNIDLIKKEEENKRIKLERNNWLIAIAGILVSLFLIYLVSLYKLRQNNLQLQLSKKELEQRKKLDRFKSESQVKIINATIDGKESERKQIAETLHDNVSALLSSANMHLQAAQKHFDGEIPVELQKTQDIILEASHKIRDLSHTLVSSVLLKFGLEYAVKDIAKKYSNSSIQIRTVIADLDRYSQDFEIKAFNIIQELLNNVLKHSKAQKAFVVIEEKDKNLHIVVKDDGKGITSEENLNSGIGLHQIKARVSMMKGDFEISSNDQQGTKVSIVIPIAFKHNTKFS